MYAIYLLAVIISVQFWWNSCMFTWSYVLVTHNVSLIVTLAINYELVSVLHRSSTGLLQGNRCILDVIVTLIYSFVISLDHKLWLGNELVSLLNPGSKLVFCWSSNMSVYGEVRFAVIFVAKFSLQFKSQFSCEFSVWINEICVLYLSFSDLGDVVATTTSKLFG